MRASLRTVLAATFMCAACEQGPERVFTPNTGDTAKQNGFAQGASHTPSDPSKSFDGTSSGDSVGRARFCDESERENVIREMVQKPILPDQSVAGIPLWTDGRPTNADDLLGRPPEKFCNPDGVYLDAFTWGPTQEVLVFFNQETRLIESVMAYQGYLGSFEGTYTSGGEKIPVRIRPRERISIAGAELDQYTSRADQQARPRAWLNNRNVTAVYRMIRETFFNAEPFAEDFDCVATKVCDLIYTTNNESNPQDTFIVIQDSGIQLRIQPDGHVVFVLVEPVRVAPFETSASIAFGGAARDMSFQFQSDRIEGCVLDLSQNISFAEFKSRCVDATDDKTLGRANYDVETQRDAVRAEFRGLNLGFLRPTSSRPVFKDGESPADDDKLFAFGFSRSLEAPVEEFRPLRLAREYKVRLEQRLRDSIIASSAGTPPERHPFATLQIQLPPLSDEPQRIGELQTLDTGTSFVPAVLAQVDRAYDALNEEQRAMLSPRVNEAVYLVEPFVDAVLSAFTHGASDQPTTFRAFQESADHRWSIGDAHFFLNGERYSVQVQYSLNYGAVTYVNVERGFNEVDSIFHALNTRFESGEPFYPLSLAFAPGNPYGLNGRGVQVRGFDRKLNTLEVTLETGDSTPTERLPARALGEGTMDLVTPGEPMSDRSGYLRQIRGERFEFVPADVVRLYGKEVTQVFYVEADGRIGRIDQFELKGALELCPGLSVRYGDNVRLALDNWARTSQRAYTDCEVVFNYSANGNVLESVASIANRRMVSVIAERVVSASVWR